MLLQFPPYKKHKNCVEPRRPVKLIKIKTEIDYRHLLRSWTQGVENRIVIFDRERSLRGGMCKEGGTLQPCVDQ